MLGLEEGCSELIGLGTALQAGDSWSKGRGQNVA